MTLSDPQLGFQGYLIITSWISQRNKVTITLIGNHTQSVEWYNYTGCSSLVVTCLTAVREVLGSNRAVGSCLYRKNHCDLQPWARAVCTLPAVHSSTQPSTLHEMVNEYRLSGWVIIINGDGDSSLQVDSQPKLGDLVWGSAAAWHCSTFIKWTEWSFAFDLVVVMTAL